MSEVYKIQVNDSEPIEVSQQVYEVSFCFNEMLKGKDKEIERLNNIINNTTVELEILLQSEDFELITMQLRNIVFRLKGSVGNETCNQEDNK